MAQIKGPEAVAPAPSPNRNRNTLEIPSTPTDKPKQGRRRWNPLATRKAGATSTGTALMG